MSTRYEGIDASHATTSVAKEGEWLGEWQVEEGEIALVISYDEVVYIEGTKDELLEFLTTAFNQVARQP